MKVIIENAIELIGTSLETKPTGSLAPGSTFYETDTTNGFIYDGTAWVLL